MIFGASILGGFPEEVVPPKYIRVFVSLSSPDIKKSRTLA